MNLRRTLPALVLISAFTTSGVAGASAPPIGEDQAAAEDAMATFDARMSELGFESDGPTDPDSGMGTDDAAFIETECMQNSGLTTPPDVVPGQTAAAGSHRWEFTPEDVATTDGGPGFAEPAAEDPGESIVAAIFTVDAEHVSDLMGYIDYITAESRLSCLESFMVDGLATSEPVSSDAPRPDFELSVEHDLGVGEQSARLSFEASYLQSDRLIAYTADNYLVVSDRSLVIVTHGSGPGGPFGELDPEAELAAIVESLG